MSLKHLKVARNVGVVAIAVALPVAVVASPASATVAYGYLQSNSSCASAVANTSCNVYIKYGTTVTLTHPKSGGTVNTCSGVPNGSPIYSEVNSGELDNRYVGVLWNSGFGAINCH